LARNAVIKRKTKETEITLSFGLDGSGKAEISSGIPFLDHMLDLLARHGLFDLELAATGDLEIDFHHTVEDIGICLGQALKEALGDKSGVRRFGWALVPMDESLAAVAIDLSGRPHLTFDADFPRQKIGSFDAELFSEFFSGFVSTAGVTLHVKLLSGENQHHKIEAIFKAFAKALDLAVSFDDRVTGVPSTKGTL
jgi:imidazoleglycerol-phosphate dehydratase